MTEQKNPLILAFIGDAVHTLYVRERLVAADAKTSGLHKIASSEICAKAQAQKLDELFETFSGTEKEIAMRARNAKHHTVPKNCTLVQYQKATAFEAVVGYNYLIKNNKRVGELCS